jgi:hypothetical protein
MNIVSWAGSFLFNKEDIMNALTLIANDATLTTIRTLLRSAKHMGLTDMVDEARLTLGGLLNVDKQLPVEYVNLSEVARELKVEIDVAKQIRRAFPSLY